MNHDLTTWLRAQLDDDERIAKAANIKQDDPEWFVSPVVASSPRHFTVRSAQDVRPIAGVQDLAGDEEGDLVGILDGGAAARHIARHDPARVLREVEAKQQILKLHRPYRVTTANDGLNWRYTRCAGCEPIDRELEPNESYWPCPHLRLLALPYSDRPGFREEWRG